MDVKGKSAIVTGSATGVGAAIARQLAGLGSNVVVNYSRSEDEAKETEAACAELGVETLLFKADISDDGACRSMANAAAEKWGGIEVLVNNAARTRPANPKDLEALNAEDFHHVYALNLVGAYQMIRATVPHMKPRGRGVITNISALAAITGEGTSLAYSASKGALNALTVFMARNLAPEIRVNAVCPGFIQTRWLRNILGEERFNQRVEEQKRITPVQKAATAEEIAEIAVFLIAGTDLITGEIMAVDYGLSKFGPLPG